MSIRSFNRLTAAIVGWSLVGLFAAGCLAYSGCFDPSRELTPEVSRKIREQTERLRSGPPPELIIRRFGEDPVELMTPTDREEPGQK